jgi:nucleotide-binding universal stress UspA family protein
MYDAILLPTDGSPGSQRASGHAIELAAEQDATLHVLHVVETVSPGASLHELIAERLTERGRELVETVADEGRSRGVTVQTAVVEGDPAEEIVDYVSSRGIDVVVMPTRGRSELLKTLVGSVTDEVIRTGNVPVIVINPSLDGT